MAKTVTQVAMDGAILKRTGPYKKKIIPLESQVKTFQYTDHLKQVKELRMLRAR
ncbi:NinE family protein [Rosenbergiella sp. S61]|uniref:NinE family protein n=1 Tax=Rosenbergiella gaditana TaxID=2726987 RepID=A0ABS5T1U6_9GAMM|nr:NinE family protein [Rosenbergiella gaditana]MBT0725432.1 NinE family protein [Rosenbergiella gaditana]